MRDESRDPLLDVGLPAPFGTLGPTLGGAWADMPPPAPPREDELATELLAEGPGDPSMAVGGAYPMEGPYMYGPPMPDAGGSYPVGGPQFYAPAPHGYAPMRAAAGVPAQAQPVWTDPIEQLTGFLNSWGEPPVLPGLRWNWNRRLYDVDVGAVQRDPGATQLAAQALRLGTSEWTYLQPYRAVDGGPWRYRWVETALAAPRAGGPPYIVRGEVGGPLAPATVVGIRAQQPSVYVGSGELSRGAGQYLGAAAPSTPLDLGAAPPQMTPQGASMGAEASPYAQYRLATRIDGPPKTYREAQAHREALAAQQAWNAAQGR